MFCFQTWVLWCLCCDWNILASQFPFVEIMFSGSDTNVTSSMKCFKRFLISPTNSSTPIVPKWMLWFCGQWPSYSRAQRRAFSVWQALCESLFLHNYYPSENVPLRSFPLAHLCWYFFSILPSAFNFHLVDFPIGQSGQREKTAVQLVKSHRSQSPLIDHKPRGPNLTCLMAQAMSRRKTPTSQGKKKKR